MNLRSDRDRRAGFTLIELLVAFTLLGLVLTVLFGGVRFAGSAYHRGSDALAANARFSVVADLLRREAGRMFPLPAGNGAEPHALLFAGSADRLSFPVFSSPQPGRAGPELVSWVVVATETGSQLTFNQATLAPGGREVHSALLLDGPYRIAFAYFGESPAGSAPHWVDRWTVPRGLPLLIRLRVTSLGGGHWPDLVVRPRIDGDAGCLSRDPDAICRDREGQP